MASFCLLLLRYTAYTVIELIVLENTGLRILLCQLNLH